MRNLLVCMGFALAAGCGNGSDSPTAPSTLPPVPFSAFRCAPPAGALVHTVPVPGAASPLVVWIDRITPAPGATVRAGDPYTISYGSRSPEGYTSAVQVFAAASVAGGFFASMATGCSSGVTTAPIPRSDRSVNLYLRVWLTPGIVRPEDSIEVVRRPPDYESSEPLSWTVMP